METHTPNRISQNFLFLEDISKANLGLSTLNESWGKNARKQFFLILKYKSLFSPQEPVICLFCQIRQVLFTISFKFSFPGQLRNNFSRKIKQEIQPKDSQMILHVAGSLFILDQAQHIWATKLCITKGNKFGLQLRYNKPTLEQ